MNRRQSTKRPVDELPLEPGAIQAAVERGVRDAARYDDDLEDFIQGAWVALLENLPRLEGLGPESLPGYIRRIARNATVDADSPVNFVSCPASRRASKNWRAR